MTNITQIKTSQEKLILAHLRKTTGITVREAMVEYSVNSLTKQISRLRNKGHNIISTWRSHPITGQRYTRYTLLEESEV
jgi:hypothetical protein